ncbi:uncharacterized protein [Littorina saxatilis]|uniref:uncharacterized protein isoform X2 n=1 Tax=Littorina saxatilis TaxID=31220 RepID=UPI0038B575AD
MGTGASTPKRAALTQHTADDADGTPGASSTLPDSNSPTRRDSVTENPQQSIPASEAPGKEPKDEEGGLFMGFGEAKPSVLEASASDEDDNSDVEPGNNSLSDDDVIRAQFQEVLSENEKLYNKAHTMWQTKQKGTQGFSSNDFIGILAKVHSSYFIYQRKTSKPHLREELKILLGERLVRSGLASSLCDIAQEIIEHRETHTGDNKDDSGGQARVLETTLRTLWNFTDWNPPVSKCVCSNGKLLPTLVRKLDEFFPALSEGLLGSLEKVIVKVALSVVHNVDLEDENVPFVRDIPGILNTLNKYINSDNNDIYRFLAMLTIADLVTDENRDQLTAQAETISYLLNLLREALKSEDHMARVHRGTFDVSELVRAVKHLARNDENKTLMLQHNALPILTAGLTSDYIKEKRGCMESLWWLSFNKKIGEKMMQETEMLDRVVEIYKDKDDECHKAADGMLFELREVLQNHTREDLRQLGKTLMTSGESGNAPDNPRHVMLSYSKANRELVTKVCTFLKEHNIPVWMDIFNMADAEDTTSQAMAEAVEGSVVFLMCYSKNYKNSQYCKQEADYANKLKKYIIPLKLQPGYDPTGWLGFIIGDKFFFDFTKEALHQQKLQKLTQKVKDRFRKSCPDEVDGAVVTEGEHGMSVVVDSSHGGMVLSAPKSQTRDEILKWEQKDVAAWMERFCLKGRQSSSTRCWPHTCS